MEIADASAPCRGAAQIAGTSLSAPHNSRPRAPQFDQAVSFGSFGQKTRFINELRGGPRSLAVLFLSPDFGHQGLYFGGKFNEFIDGHADSWGNFSHMIQFFPVSIGAGQGYFL